MGEVYRVWSRAPGARFATLVDQRGRRSEWGRVAATRESKTRRCLACGRLVAVGAPSWVRFRSSDPVSRRERVCAACLDRLAAAGT